MLGTKLLNGLDDLSIAAILTHWFSGVVGVATSTVPVTRHWLGIESHIDTHQLAHTNHEIPRHPHLITRGNALARTNLVLPLSRHDLSIDTRDSDASVQASLVVRVSNWSPESTVETCSAVVRSLGSRETSLRETEWANSILLEESVLLLDSEPRLEAKILVESF